MKTMTLTTVTVFTVLAVGVIAGCYRPADWGWELGVEVFDANDRYELPDFSQLSGTGEGYIYLRPYGKLNNPSLIGDKNPKAEVRIIGGTITQYIRPRINEARIREFTYEDTKEPLVDNVNVILMFALFPDMDVLRKDLLLQEEQEEKCFRWQDDGRWVPVRVWPDLYLAEIDIEAEYRVGRWTTTQIVSISVGYDSDGDDWADWYEDAVGADPWNPYDYPDLYELSAEMEKVGQFYVGRPAKMDLSIKPGLPPYSFGIYMPDGDYVIADYDGVREPTLIEGGSMSLSQTPTVGRVRITHTFDEALQGLVRYEVNDAAGLRVTGGLQIEVIHLTPMDLDLIISSGTEYAVGDILNARAVVTGGHPPYRLILRIGGEVLAESSGDGGNFNFSVVIPSVVGNDTPVSLTAVDVEEQVVTREIFVTITATVEGESEGEPEGEGEPAEGEQPEPEGEGEGAEGEPEGEGEPVPLQATLSLDADEYTVGDTAIATWSVSGGLAPYMMTIRFPGGGPMTQNGGEGDYTVSAVLSTPTDGEVRVLLRITDAEGTVIDREVYITVYALQLSVDITTDKETYRVGEVAQATGVVLGGYPPYIALLFVEDESEGLLYYEPEDEIVDEEGVTRYPFC